MASAYSSFDTLTLEFGDTLLGGEAPPASPLPVLARIPHASPHVDPEAPPAVAPDGSRRQVDAAHAAAPIPNMGIESLTSSVVDVHAEVASVAAPPRPAPSQAPSPQPPTAPPPASGAPSGLVATPSTPIETPAAPDAPPPTPAIKPEIDEPSGFVGMLLRAEAAVAPYSQIIVLLTLLAAAGLTVLLLQGDPSRLNDALPGGEGGEHAIAPVLADVPTLPSPDPMTEAPRVATAVGPGGIAPSSVAVTPAAPSPVAPGPALAGPALAGPAATNPASAGPAAASPAAAPQNAGATPPIRVATKPKIHAPGGSGPQAQIMGISPYQQKTR